MNRRVLALSLLLAALALPPAVGQSGPRDEPPPRPLPSLDPIDFFQVMEVFERVVRGAPYSARAVTEISQDLPDGNRIVRKTETAVARDAAGRVRRTITLAAPAPIVPAGEPPRTTVLVDPVAGVGYQLEADSRTARRIRPLPPRGGARDGADSLPPAPPGSRSAGAPVVEALGRRTIEGVEADGTRTTFTLAPGEIGNEKPILVVHERWYAPELQIVVASKRTDPRFGTTAYRLTSIERGAPDPALLEVPEGYAIVDGPAPPPRPRR